MAESAVPILSLNTLNKSRIECQQEAVLCFSCHLRFRGDVLDFLKGDMADISLLHVYTKLIEVTYYVAPARFDRLDVAVLCGAQDTYTMRSSCDYLLESGHGRENTVLKRRCHFACRSISETASMRRCKLSRNFWGFFSFCVTLLFDASTSHALKPIKYLFYSIFFERPLRGEELYMCNTCLFFCRQESVAVLSPVEFATSWEEFCLKQKPPVVVQVRCFVL